MVRRSRPFLNVATNASSGWRNVLVTSCGTHRNHDYAREGSGGGAPSGEASRSGMSAEKAPFLNMASRDLFRSLGSGVSSVHAENDCSKFARDSLSSGSNVDVDARIRLVIEEVATLCSCFAEPRG